MMSQKPELLDIIRPERSASSQFLNKVMVELRRERLPVDPDQPWYVRYDETPGGTFAQLWFMTRGCSWDRQGQCTMCNYGHSPVVSTDDMINSVTDGLSSIDRPINSLYISPSGSLLDPREVPAEARRFILKVANEFPSNQFSFETRPETVTPVLIDEIHTLMPDKKIAIGFGLESTDNWILRHCINKPDTVTSFIKARQDLYGMDVICNTSLGAAFLSPAESINDTVKSVRWALENGADLALVFPMHVKGNTLLEWMYINNLYTPPSLWSLIEVFKRLDESSLPKISTSWYRSDYGADSGVIASPSTCDKCHETVLGALDEFRASPSADTVNKLCGIECTCKDVWRESLRTPLPDLRERVFSVYERLAEDMSLGEWWDSKRQAIADELYS